MSVPTRLAFHIFQLIEYPDYDWWVTFVEMRQLRLHLLKQLEMCYLSQRYFLPFYLRFISITINWSLYKEALHLLSNF